MTVGHDELYARALSIIEGHANGFGLPILRHLALRAYGPAVLYLANWNTQGGRAREAGRLSDWASPLGQMRKAWRQGEHLAAQNLALTYFNMGNIAAHRHWLRRAARDGDEDAARDVATFATRYPHEAARRLRRVRPLRRDER